MINFYIGVFCLFINSLPIINQFQYYIYIQGVWLASLAYSLLVHAFHLYILHGRLLLVLLYSMSKLNNNGSKARYSNRPSLIIKLVI